MLFYHQGQKRLFLMTLVLLPLPFLLILWPLFLLSMLLSLMCCRICYRCYYWYYFQHQGYCYHHFCCRWWFTVIIIDIHFLAFVDIINVIVVIVAIASFVVNGSIDDTGIVISICNTTFFLFRFYQRLLLFLFLDRSIYSFRGVLILLRFSKEYFFPWFLSHFVFKYISLFI